MSSLCLDSVVPSLSFVGIDGCRFGRAIYLHTLYSNFKQHYRTIHTQRSTTKFPHAQRGVHPQCRSFRDGSYARDRLCSLGRPCGLHRGRRSEQHHRVEVPSIHTPHRARHRTKRRPARSLLVAVVAHAIQTARVGGSEQVAVACRHVDKVFVDVREDVHCRDSLRTTQSAPAINEVGPHIRIQRADNNTTCSTTETADPKIPRPSLF